MPRRLRPRLDPVTLRWLAEEELRASRQHATRAFDGLAQDEADREADLCIRLADDCRLRARRLRALATREERRK